MYLSIKKLTFISSIVNSLIIYKQIDSPGYSIQIFKLVKSFITGRVTRVNWYWIITRGQRDDPVELITGSFFKFSLRY